MSERKAVALITLSRSEYDLTDAQWSDWCDYVLDNAQEEMGEDYGEVKFALKTVDKGLDDAEVMYDGIRDPVESSELRQVCESLWSEWSHSESLD